LNFLFEDSRLQEVPHIGKIPPSLHASPFYQLPTLDPSVVFTVILFVPGTLAAHCFCFLSRLIFKGKKPKSKSCASPR
jgi:hypothetical protein